MFKASAQALHKLIASQEAEVVNKIVSHTLGEKAALKKRQAKARKAVDQLKHRVIEEKKMWISKFGGTMEDAVSNSLQTLKTIEAHLSKMGIRRGELGCDVHFPDSSGQKYKLRSCPDIGVYLAARDLILEKVDGTFSVKIDSKNGLLLDLSDVNVLLQVFDFKIKGKTSSKILGSVLSPKRVETKIQLKKIHIPLQYTPEKQRWTADKKKLVFDVKIVKSIKGSLTAPDKLIQWIVTSVVPRLVAKFAPLLPGEIGAYFQDNNNRVLVEGRFSIKGDISGAVWAAPLDGSSADSEEARRLVRKSGLSDLRCRVLTHLIQVVGHPTDPGTKSLSLSQLNQYYIKNATWDEYFSETYVNKAYAAMEEEESSRALKRDSGGSAPVQIHPSRSKWYGGGGSKKKPPSAAHQAALRNKKSMHALKTKAKSAPCSDRAAAVCITSESSSKSNSASSTQSCKPPALVTSPSPVSKASSQSRDVETSIKLVVKDDAGKSSKVDRMRGNTQGPWAQLCRLWENVLNEVCLLEISRDAVRQQKDRSDAEAARDETEARETNWFLRCLDKVHELSKFPLNFSFRVTKLYIQLSVFEAAEMGLGLWLAAVEKEVALLKRQRKKRNRAPDLTDKQDPMELLVTAKAKQQLARDLIRQALNSLYGLHTEFKAQLRGGEGQVVGEDEAMIEMQVQELQLLGAAPFIQQFVIPMIPKMQLMLVTPEIRMSSEYTRLGEYIVDITMVGLPGAEVRSAGPSPNTVGTFSVQPTPLEAQAAASKAEPIEKALITHKPRNQRLYAYHLLLHRFSINMFPQLWNEQKELFAGTRTLLWPNMTVLLGRFGFAGPVTPLIALAHVATVQKFMSHELKSNVAKGTGEGGVGSGGSGQRHRLAARRDITSSLLEDRPVEVRPSGPALSTDTLSKLFKQEKQITGSKHIAATATVAEKKQVVAKQAGKRVSSAEKRGARLDQLLGEVLAELEDVEASERAFGGKDPSKLDVGAILQPYLFSPAHSLRLALDVKVAGHHLTPEGAKVEKFPPAASLCKESVFSPVRDSVA